MDGNGRNRIGTVDQHASGESVSIFSGVNGWNSLQSGGTAVDASGAGIRFYGSDSGVLELPGGKYCGNTSLWACKVI